MGLAITYTNVLIDEVPTITDPGTNEVPANISSPDHSLTYTSGVSIVEFEISYGAQVASYVAISGHNAVGTLSATVELWDDTTLIDSVFLTRNNNVMFTFPQMGFTDLRIVFVVAPNSAPVTVSYVAAGLYLDVDTGEQAGYNRSWLNRHLMQRTTSNSITAPVSSLTQNKSLNGMLSLPNQAADFSQDEWQDFIDFSLEQPFFIKEFEDKPESSYICFDPKFSTKSHSQTRELDVLNLSFTLFNGL